MDNKQHNSFMQRAIELAEKGMNNGFGGPFGAVVVKDGKIVGEGYNSVIHNNDPTAHAEVLAIREACKNLTSFELNDCTIYTSCEPCPMCLGAIYWARISKVVYACTKEDAAQISFDDDDFYGEIAKDMKHRKIDFEELMRDKALPLFSKWKMKPDKKNY
ncbi:tRNA(Arg) A34 adenosine deaminase TadA [Tangfeifania diversioriginum]|uniref:tRNA(Arg) A34 adenosine deaminase TadA n=1 Tax=Tangfeifania diversioriginum TaxID=1168035 RepID=A0A1M6L3R2_9BACT|nr:nucleoside deaminase [Tangfeifania diversioriginum]SHJ65861.1 tRNA(Arg) A34 adenosine deaminase TadA [Tangfeifania diversioriginum]